MNASAFKDSDRVLKETYIKPEAEKQAINMMFVMLMPILTILYDLEAHEKFVQSHESKLGRSLNVAESFIIMLFDFIRSLFSKI